MDEAAGPPVRVVVVNWNSGHWLAQCLGSLREHAGPALAEVVVVDNGSADGSDDVALAQNGRLIRAGANLGFARACNLGAAGAATPYLLFLNPDAAVREGTIATVLRFMESEAASRVAVCGVRLVGEDGVVQHHATVFPTARTMFRAEDRTLRFDHLSSREVDHVIGAFYLIRRSVFEALGGFDERFFVYLEDMDLSRRVAKAGWKTWYLAEAVAFHKGGGTSEQVKAARQFYSTRSRLLYAAKHLPPAKSAFVFAATMTLEPAARIGRALLRRSMPELRESLAAYRMLAADLPGIVRTMRHKPLRRAD
ncbi:MAG TPA: glycosyltransferase family 2 protein [Allosphingosinicella sp.]